MGDPKKLRKKYKTRIHPWIKKEIDDGKILTKEFGLGKKKEILIANSFLKKYMNIAKRLIAQKTEQGKKETQQVLNKLQRLGILRTDANLDHILTLNINDILERRLQSIAFHKGLCRSMKQARQFIVHRHILIGDKEITSPSYLVSVEEESQIGFKEKSSLFDENHPERAQPEVVEEIKPEATPKQKNKKETKENPEAKTENVIVKPANTQADSEKTEEATQ